MSIILKKIAAFRNKIFFPIYFGHEYLSEIARIERIENDMQNKFTGNYERKLVWRSIAQYQCQFAARNRWACCYESQSQKLNR